MGQSNTTKGLVEGADAPEFRLPGDSGRTISSSDYSGSNLVIYFYPKDDTKGCTKESIEFTQAKAAFAAANTQIVGISADSVKSHDKFKAKHALDLTLASDEEKTTIEDYGVWVEKNMYGRKYMGIERATFLVDANGKIARIWRKVRVTDHVASVLKAARELA